MEINFFCDNYFISSVILLVLSVISFQLNKINLSLAFLFFGSLVLGVFVAGLDSFINLWDEQYHALVAKNLLKHPLKPVLIEEPIFDFVYSWAYTTTWLHKQPLFLWQIALSIKLFGLNELAVRLPSVLMHAVMTFFIYRTGRVTFSKTTGYYAALLFTCAYFPLEFLTGFYATDHNDNAFFFYSFASFWALLEYQTSKKNVFIVLVGLLSGCAILCKWLTGLLPYLVWLIIICSERKKENIFQPLKKLLLSFLICVAVFVPWQVFAYINYPVEYARSMAFNSKHIFEPLEGHGGDAAFYYNALFEQYGEGFLIPVLVLLCFGFMIHRLKNKSHRLFILSAVIITYLFFTLVATKMYGYVFVTFPFFILGITVAIEALLQKIRVPGYAYLKKTADTLVVVFILIMLFNHAKLYKHHSDKERAASRAIEVKEKMLYLAIKENFKDARCLLFNCNMSFASHILGIFYTGYPSFNQVITPGQIVKAKALNYKLISIDDGRLPEYVLNDKAIIKIKFIVN